MSVELILGNLNQQCVDYEGNSIPALVSEEGGEVLEYWTFKYALLILISNYKPEDKKQAFENKLAMDSLGQRIYDASREEIDEIKVSPSEFELLMTALKTLAADMPSPIVGFLNNNLQTAQTMTPRKQETIPSDEN